MQTGFGSHLAKSGSLSVAWLLNCCPKEKGGGVEAQGKSGRALGEPH